MAVGSSYSTVKAAAVAALKARPALSAVAVTYRAPETSTEVQGESGSNESIFFDDAEGGDLDNEIIASLPLRLEETYQLKLVVQVLRPSSDGTQQDADERVDELLYEVLKEIASDPTLGITGFDYLHITTAAFNRRTGFLGTSGGHAASCELMLSVEARLSFT